MITEGKKVNILYSIQFTDKSSALDAEQEKLEYIQGDNDILPALEVALEGLKVGDTTCITLSPAEAFGPINNDHFIIVDINQIPKKLRFINAKVYIEDEHNEMIEGRVTKINLHQVILDLNHPLAGKTLIYTIKILSISNGYMVH